MTGDARSAPTIEPPAPREARLGEGTRCLVRPLRPSDEAELRRGLAQLSAKARYQRFLGATVELSDAQLHYLLHPDDIDHIALVAEVPTEDAGAPRGIAVTRCIRDDSDPETAEVAIAVADAWQGRGVASLLLRHLAAWAYRLGIRHFTALVLASNEPVLRAIDHVGPRENRGLEANDVLEVGWRLDPARFPP